MLVLSTDWLSSTPRIAGVSLVVMNLIDVTEATNRVVGGLECRYITCAGQLFRYRSTLLFAQNVRIFWTIIHGVYALHNFKSGRT